MMHLFNWFRKKIDSISTVLLGGSSYSTRLNGSEAYAREGYALCSVVMRCVSLVAKNLASAPLVVWQGEDEVAPEHPLRKLLEHPNPLQSGPQLLENLCAYNRLMGNAFLEMIENGSGVPQELWCWPAQNMEVLGGETRMPRGYKWRKGSISKTWDVDFVTGLSDMMHWKTFNPVDSLVGLAPLSAAAYEVDQHNAAGRWNYNLLRNAAVPKGALKTTGNLTEDQRRQLREQLEERYEGPDNARRGMILEGGLDWKDIGLSPQEMDWLAGRHDAGRCIASVFGVPDQMVPIPGSQTFANYREARLSLWEDTVLPLLGELLDQLNTWLAPRFGDGLRIDYDHDSIDALEPRRQERWDSVKTADWLTIDEKREATGYGSYEPDADAGAAGRIWVPSGLIPIDDSVPDDGEGEGEGIIGTGAIAEDVARTALNGAQVSSLVEVVQAVADGRLPATSAIEMLLQAFPTMNREEAQRIINPAASFTPAAPPSGGGA